LTASIIPSSFLFFTIEESQKARTGARLGVWLADADNTAQKQYSLSSVTQQQYALSSDADNTAQALFSVILGSVFFIFFHSFKVLHLLFWLIGKQHLAQQKSAFLDRVGR
jgi:hypothetical protein